MAKILGMEKRKFLLVCNKAISIHNINELGVYLINFIGMTPARKARVDKYPYKGKGGIGYTAFFPLTESYIVFDVYTELNQTEILLSTCKPDIIHSGALLQFLNREFGPSRFIGTL